MSLWPTCYRLTPLYAHIALNVKVVFLTCVYKSVNRCRKQKLVTQNESVLKSEPTSFLNSVQTFKFFNSAIKYIKMDFFIVTVKGFVFEENLILQNQDIFFILIQGFSQAHQPNLTQI
jgi:hypothetical protein